MADEDPVITAHEMMPFLHATFGGATWFMNWVPQSGRALAAACIGLVILGIIERWLAAIRSMSGALWWPRADLVTESDKKSALYHPDAGGIRHIHPRNPTALPTDHPSLPVIRLILKSLRPRSTALGEVFRGILYSLQACLRFAFMLVVMTAQFYYIISIVIGMGIGETLFGRLIPSSSSIEPRD
ncbi:hypothetical protein FA13DRAFT_1642490 [Coprinellus micaceus]|uniref:Copper transport protein n=1 Tax=Coprinellus micaceus TaxID=71717 RepID=A0A4Y7SIR2_COPMI|nr:hypothetical protein FA13DRAFT_1642490 [Coprinellus micaceus]